ncbi:Uncharacterized protein HZ326_0847 [Fusarium oxysporum f. sp. albedinis]|nr:Uncharacterized protein HZ326_0847 [Fusarium oxysporum f. sp. albedinis]
MIGYASTSESIVVCKGLEREIFGSGPLKFQSFRSPRSEIAMELAVQLSLQQFCPDDQSPKEQKLLNQQTTTHQLTVFASTINFINHHFSRYPKVRMHQAD